MVDAAVRCVTQYGECLDLLRDLVGDQAAIEVVNEIADPQRQAFLLFKEGKDLNGLWPPTASPISPWPGCATATG